MWVNNDVFKEDLEYICSTESLPWKEFQHKTILVTGCTGLIGSTLASALLYAGEKYNLDLHIIALVRDIEKARKTFKEQLRNNLPLKLIQGSVEDIPSISEKVDFIIHCACPTASSYFIKKPVETIKTSVIGTMNMLDLAVSKKVKGFVYLSSMEVYGAVDTENPLSESDLGYVDPIVVRSCYPESKRMCEALCAAYAKEYGVKAMSVRLAQTFGPGVASSDERIFAMMARCVKNQTDIVLQTKGTSKHVYLYTAQAVTAILMVLLKGTAGDVYNAANPATYSSIYEMGNLVAKEFTSGKLKVIIADQKDTGRYPEPSFLNLNINNLKKLGWKPQGDLIDMYNRMMKTM